MSVRVSDDIICMIQVCCTVLRVYQLLHCLLCCLACLYFHPDPSSVSQRRMNVPSSNEMMINYICLTWLIHFLLFFFFIDCDILAILPLHHFHKTKKPTCLKKGGCFFSLGAFILQVNKTETWDVTFAFKISDCCYKAIKTLFAGLSAVFLICPKSQFHI